MQRAQTSKCRCLAPEWIAMLQDPSKLIDQFAFKNNNVLHQLDKLGEMLSFLFRSFRYPLDSFCSVSVVNRSRADLCRF